METSQTCTINGKTLNYDETKIRREKYWRRGISVTALVIAVCVIIGGIVAIVIWSKLDNMEKKVKRTIGKVEEMPIVKFFLKDKKNQAELQTVLQKVNEIAPKPLLDTGIGVIVTGLLLVIIISVGLGMSESRSKKSVLLFLSQSIYNK